MNKLQLHSETIPTNGQIIFTSLLKYDVKPAQAVTCIKSHLFYCLVIENFI